MDKNKYKYGFKTEIDSVKKFKGLSIDTVKGISAYRKEPDFILEFRMKAYKSFLKKEPPAWSSIDYNLPDFNNVFFLAELKKKKKIQSRSDVDPEIISTMNRLGIPIQEQNALLNVAVDFVFNSSSVGVFGDKSFEKLGVIFCSISDAILKHPDLVKKYIGTAVPLGDNYFSDLNSSTFSDGSFVYVPPGVKCPVDLSSYFRINDKESAQFERTLIIADVNSEVSYLEGCTALESDKKQLHAAVVEIIALEGARVNYHTVQHWYAGEDGSGVYNFVTKRGICHKNSKIQWVQVEVGASATWKYPSCILVGEGSEGSFSSISFTNNIMATDTGSKMIHLAPNTKSSINAKSIGADSSSNTFRSKVFVSSKAHNTISNTECSSLIIGDDSKVKNIPIIQSMNSTARITHEADVFFMDQDVGKYLENRGIDNEEYSSLIVSGFCNDILNRLPLEFLEEAKTLLNMKIETSLG